MLSADVDEDIQAEPVANKPVRKQAASAFDLLQGSDEEAEQPSKAAASFSALKDSSVSAAENGEATDEDSDAESDEADSDADQQVSATEHQMHSLLIIVLLVNSHARCVAFEPQITACSACL